MNESKTIKILVSSSLIFIIIGGFLLWQQGWFTEQVSILKLIPKLTGFSEEMTYLVLFQNNLELRPSGGYLGNFGIVKINKGEIRSFEIHDTNIFDGFGKIVTDPPQPIKDGLKISNWQMRDGNWSPDFPIAAQQVEYFYHLQGGQENFDGIIGFNASVLVNLLKLTGPIYLPEFDKEFKSEDALYQLEYEVEKGYIERGIESGRRKSILKNLAKEILNKLMEKDIWQQNDLKELAFQELDNRNIILFFKDAEIQEKISQFSWTGEVNRIYPNDYLMLVEANLAARKSNAFIKREVEYNLDLTKAEPEVTLRIKYIHQGEEKDWFNDDYRAYLRVYTPYQSWLLEAKNVEDETVFSEELGKTVFGNWIEILTGQEKIIEFKYSLPEKIKQENQYRILIQKQIGIESLPIKIFIKTEQEEYTKNQIIDNDWEGIISF